MFPSLQRPITAKSRVTRNLRKSCAPRAPETCPSDPSERRGLSNSAKICPNPGKFGEKWQPMGGIWPISALAAMGKVALDLLWTDVLPSACSRNPWFAQALGTCEFSLAAGGWRRAGRRKPGRSVKAGSSGGPVPTSLRPPLQRAAFDLLIQCRRGPTPHGRTFCPPQPAGPGGAGPMLQAVW